MLPSLRSALPVLTVLALSTAGAARAAEPAKPAPAGARAEEVPIYDPDVLGEKAIVFYQKTALDSGRRLFLNLGTNDCAPCVVFNRAIHREKFFDAFIKQFVPANIDVSNMPNASLVDKYLINPRAPLPAILIFLPDGRFIEALAQGEAAALAKKGEPAVQEWLLSRFVKTDQ